MPNFLRLYLIAMQFLTIIPLPFDTRCQKDDLGRATACFPLAGLTIGGLLAAINGLIAPYLPRPLCDALLITALAAMTGALHLDGLADVCDGLAARGDRERFLAVMKDSHVGAVGAVGLVLGLLLKWQALLAVPEPLKWQALLLFPLMARCVQVVAMYKARHARQDGLGAAFVQGMGSTPLVIALTTAVIASASLLSLKGMVALAAACGLSLMVRCYFQRRLGGITGDILGCINELAEILALLLLSVLPSLCWGQSL